MDNYARYSLLLEFIENPGDMIFIEMVVKKPERCGPVFGRWT
jgi:hypothetical protein